VDLLGSNDSLFAFFTGLLEIFMLHNVSTASTRGVSGKLLDLFLVFRTDILSGFYQFLFPVVITMYCFSRSVASGHGALRPSAVSGVSVILILANCCRQL
jgi:hypothetical protein